MTSTAKNYAGQNLRGRSFKGQDLSGSDFSGTDLRGADFTDAILRGANFSKSKTGVQKRWLTFQVIIAIIISAISCCLVASTGIWVALFFTPDNIKSFTIAPGIAMIIIFIAIFFAVIRQGFTAATFGTVAIAVAVIGAVAVAGMATGIIAGAGAVTVAGTWSVAFAGAGAGTGTTLLLSIYVAWRTLKGDPKFDILLKFAIAFASIGGTSFRGSDLRNVDFTKANLKSNDLRDSRKQSTNLTCTLWKQSINLARSRLGTSILSNPEVRELLVTGKPNETQSYEGLNLRGANLEGVYLKEVNFKRAILNEASFCNANLESVNFTEAQVIGTDFTGAQMKGVCLEGWSYDHTTKLDEVDSL